MSTLTVAEVAAKLPAGSLVSIDVSTPTATVYKPVDDFLTALQEAQDLDNVATAAGQDVNMISTSEGAATLIPDPANPGQTVTVVPRFYSVTTYRRIVVDEVLTPLV
ncbi:hypothetical protein [Laspinema olomoucense]|uniref:hypothetical protein n=1 Tax=Laspinema olomoucense TaxID=3231600 RepID=UPI0021BAFD0D|nr:hypothetical protein [Laspinema sp. D3a]MCT7987612.1 hypothetical protein [Laspinema sp. D3a]